METNITRELIAVGRFLYRDSNDGNLLNGNHTYRVSTGEIVNSTFKNGLQHGESKLWSFITGQLLVQSNFCDGYYHGESINKLFFNEYVLFEYGKRVYAKQLSDHQKI